MAEASKSRGKNRKIGREIKKCAAYKASHHREQNKCKRVRKSNGYDNAMTYALAHGIHEWAKKNIRK